MLSLFRDQEVPVSEDFAFDRVRELLVSSLNKGIIPEWEAFYHELPILDEAEALEKIKTYFFMLTKWSFLEEILKTNANEFYFHEPLHCQYLRSDGTKAQFSVPLSSEDWQLWLEIVSMRFRQNWNTQQPFVSFHGNIFKKSFRFSLIHQSTSPLGKSKLVLRAISEKPFALECFSGATELPSLIEKKKNILIAGSTGSGKTSLLSCLLGYVPKDEHIVILEDTYELVTQHSFATRLLSGDSKERSLESYLTYSLRLSPERIILGEMRSSEVIPFLLAMNTGHRGLMGTVHSSSAVDALHRVALLFSLYSDGVKLSFERIMELMCRNLEYVVFMEHKKVGEIIRILGCDRGTPFFEKVTG